MKSATLTAFAVRKQRDAAAPEWSKAYALLKAAARVVEDGGGAPVFSTLFGVAAPPKKKKTAPQPDGTPAAVMKPNGTPTPSAEMRV